MSNLEKAREHADNAWTMPAGRERDMEYALALRHTISALEEQENAARRQRRRIDAFEDDVASSGFGS